MMPDFLRLPDLPGKPRTRGMTHVLDKGIPVGAMADHLASHVDYVDVWKFGWGTAYAEHHLEHKIGLLRSHDVIACLGGTLLEIAWAQGKADACLEWAESVGIEAVEVSRGTVPMSTDEKQELIASAAQRFTVFAETGYKSADRILLPAEWHLEIVGDVDAGARFVVAEGRESGTVGVYDADGTPQPDIIDAAIRAAGLSRTFFEAPRKDQQAWFVNTHGPDVNLGNVAPDDLLPLQTLRLGLRADTALRNLAEQVALGQST
jgi:phosphosulfolactate synthase